LVEDEFDMPLLCSVVPDLDEALAWFAIGIDCYLGWGITDKKLGLDEACTSFNVGSDCCVVEVEILVIRAVHWQDDLDIAQVFSR
jgi:hypothetical protein